ncbi:MAG: DUF1003 domain-containing protein [Actinomycetota bacterium]|nr:DUF1003 domain-containing protein [Actinomycetota bacterium]
MTRTRATPHHTRVAARPTRHRSPANQYRHDDLRLSARIADKVTAVFGSWAFIITQSALIVIWLGYNGYVALHYLRGGAFDPYPFILLNLLFSTQAAYAAPLILLSQNRTAERDRIKAEHDFDVNILALRSLAEIMADVHDQKAQANLLRRIRELLGTDDEEDHGGGRPDRAIPNDSQT